MPWLCPFIYGLGAPFSSFVLISAQSWHHTGMSYQAKRCRGNTFPPECIYEDNCGTLTPNVSPGL
jgi:hypothetical protein